MTPTSNLSLGRTSTQDVAPNQLPCRNLPPPLAPARCAVPETNSEGVFTLVKAGPPPGRRRLSRESDSRSQENRAKIRPRKMHHQAARKVRPRQKHHQAAGKPYQETGSAPQSRMSRARTMWRCIKSAEPAASPCYVVRATSLCYAVQAANPCYVVRAMSPCYAVQARSPCYAVQAPNLATQSHSESNEAKQGRQYMERQERRRRNKRVSAQAVHEIPWPRRILQARRRTQTRTLRCSDQGELHHSGRKIRHAGLPVDPIAASRSGLRRSDHGRTHEGKAYKHCTDRLKELTEMFVKGGLNGVRMKTITENELTTLFKQRPALDRGRPDHAESHASKRRRRKGTSEEQEPNG